MIRRLGKTITMLLTTILMMAPMARSQQEPAPEMSYRQAQRAFMATVPYAKTMLSLFEVSPLDQRTVRLMRGTVEFDANGVHYTIPLRGLRKVTAHCDKYVCYVYEEGDSKGRFLKYYNADKRETSIVFGFEIKGTKNFYPVCSQVQNHDECMNAAAQFAAALNSLHIYAMKPMASDEDFQKQAAVWRALATKPALPDAVRVRRMMAEDAIKTGQPEDALMYYEQGLEEYPTWPEGWFNAALVAGELGRYDDAAEFMQNYLELVPDAKDAQSARDQMEIWKIKAQEKK